MTRRILSRILAGLIGIMMIGTAHASVQYTTTPLDNSGGYYGWQYNFIVLPTQDFTDLMVMFPYDYFLTLDNPNAPSGWDTTSTSPPNSQYSSNGLFIAVNSTVQPNGVAINGFSVTTYTTDANAPPTLLYDLYNSASGSPNAVESGTTVELVPEPSTWVLLSLALGGIALGRRWTVKPQQINHTGKLS